jgi:16S rRNA (cytosine967-C5)-methyltransferase
VNAGAFAEPTLDAVLSSGNHSRQDKALATELAYGCLRWRFRLEAVIARCSRSPSNRIHPETALILQIALYQLLFLDRIPESAAVDQAVTHAFVLRGAKTAGFVNAVLRRAVRERASADPPPDGSARSLAQYYSQPLRLVEEWTERFGPERTERLLREHNAKPPLTVRINTLKVSPPHLFERWAGEGLDYEPLDCSGTAAEIRAPSGAVRDLPGFAEGHFTVQDCASQFIAPLLKPRIGERILDACAAPGGKAAHLCALTGSGADLTVNEEDELRMSLLKENLERLGVTNARRAQGSVLDPSHVRALGQFDAILLDAPCSNLGVLRRNPEARYRLREGDLAKFGLRQSEMLNSLGRAVKPGGRLLYSVCSVSREETERVVERFLAHNTDFRHDPIVPDEVPIRGAATSDGFLMTLGLSAGARGDVLMDGFFAARFIRGD